MTKTTAGTGGCYISMHSGIPIKNDTTYVVSGWVKASRPVYVSGYFLSINRPLDNAYRLGTAQTLTTDWVRYSWIYNAGSGHAGTYLSRDIIYIDDDLPLDIYWSGFQVEERDSLSAYVNGVRASKIEDLSPYGLSATNNGATLSSEGADFHNNYVDVADMSEVELSDVTFSFWAKVDALTKDNDFITKGSHTSGTPMIIWFDDTVGGGDLGVGNTNAISVSTHDGTTNHWVSTPTNTINDLDWHHIVAVVDPTNNQIKIYVDGALVASNTKSWNGIKNTTDMIRFGNPTPTTVANLDGSMSNVKIYNRALSETEVKQLYNQGI